MDMAFAHKSEARKDVEGFRTVLNNLDLERITNSQPVMGGTPPMRNSQREMDSLIQIFKIQNSNIFVRTFSKSIRYTSEEEGNESV